MENKENNDQEKKNGCALHEDKKRKGIINGETEISDNLDNESIENTTTVDTVASKNSNIDDANFPSHFEEVNKTMEYTEKHCVESFPNTSETNETKESAKSGEREHSLAQRDTFGDTKPTQDNSIMDGNTDICKDNLRVLKDHKVEEASVDSGTYKENTTEHTRTLVRDSANKVAPWTDAATLDECLSSVDDRETNKIDWQTTENNETCLYGDSHSAGSSDSADNRAQCPALQSDAGQERSAKDSDLTHSIYAGNNQPVLKPDICEDNISHDNSFSDLSHESNPTPSLEMVGPVQSPDLTDPPLPLQAPTVQSLPSSDSFQPGVLCETSPHVEHPPGSLLHRQDNQEDTQDTCDSDNEDKNKTCNRQVISDEVCDNSVVDGQQTLQERTLEGSMTDSDSQCVNDLAKQIQSLASSPGMENLQPNLPEKTRGQPVPTSNSQIICDNDIPSNNAQSQTLSNSGETHTELSSINQSVSLHKEEELGISPSGEAAKAHSSQNVMQNSKVGPLGQSVTHGVIQTSETERYLNQDTTVEVCKQEPDMLQSNIDNTDVQSRTDTENISQDDIIRSHSSGSFQSQTIEFKTDDSVHSQHKHKSILSKLHNVFGKSNKTYSAIPKPQNMPAATQDDIGSCVDPNMTSQLDASCAVQEGRKEDGGSDDSSDTEFLDVTSRLSDHVMQGVEKKMEKKSDPPGDGDTSDDDDDDDFYDAFDDEADDNLQADNTNEDQSNSTNQDLGHQRQKSNETNAGELSPCKNDSTMSTQPQKLAARRTHIPEKPSMGLFNLWNVLKNCKGKELSKIAMPVNFNEPLSMLQRLTEELEYSEVLDRAARCEDAAEQMTHVAAFTVSAYATTLYRTGKPFNPLLGETFEFDRTEDLGWWSLAEQVSHHPPTLATHAEGRGWTLWQEFTMTTRFRGRYVQIVPMGIAHLKFHESGNHYTWRKVTTTVHNIIVGRLWVDNEGDMTINNHTTQHTCHLHYHPYSYFSRHPHRQVTGEVKDKNGIIQWTLSGTWCTQIEACPVVHSAREEEEEEEEEEERQTSCYSSGSQPGKGRSEDVCSHTGPAQVLWTVRPPPEGSEKMYNLSRLAIEMNELEQGVAPTDSRLRPDQRSMEEGDWGEANRLKLLLEEKQRAARRRRQDDADIAEQQGKAVEEYQPTWFNKERDLDTDVALHVYTGHYWQCKRSQQWHTCPDIFL